MSGDQADQITGHLTDGTWKSTLAGDRAGSFVPFAGNYTLVIPGYDTNSTLPAGDGFGTLKVNRSGQVEIRRHFG